MVPAQSYVSGPSYVSNPSYVTETVVSNPGQMSFYDRLRAQKMGGRTELLSGQGDVNQQTRFGVTQEEGQLSFYQKLKRQKEQQKAQMNQATYQSEFPEPL